MTVLSKPLLLRQLGDLVQRIRAANAICPQWFGEEVEAFELQLSAIEAEIGQSIDLLMSSRLNAYNAAQHSTYDINGLSGRWGEKGQRRADVATNWGRPADRERQDGQGVWFPCPDCGGPRTKQAIRCRPCAERKRKQTKSWHDER